MGFRRWGWLMDGRGGRDKIEDVVYERTLIIITFEHIWNKNFVKSCLIKKLKTYDNVSDCI